MKSELCWKIFGFMRLAEREHKMESFHQDLTIHDCNALENMPEDANFFWGLGESSTKILDMDTKIDFAHDFPEDHWYAWVNGSWISFNSALEAQTYKNNYNENLRRGQTP